MKAKSIGGKWYINDRGSIKEFDTAHDAWLSIMISKEIRPHTYTVPKSLYPVRTLDPRPSKVVKKVYVV